MSIHAPPGIVQVSRLVWRLALWVGRRPFLARPRTWLLAALLATACSGIILISASGLWSLSILLAVIAIGCCAVFVAWTYLRRKSPYPLVFVSLFDVDTPPEQTAAAAHLRAMVRFLEEKFTGDRTVTVRVVRVPLSRTNAERLLQGSGALAVVHGRVSAVADVARWECELALRGRPESERLSLSVSDKTVRHGKIRVSRRGRRARQAGHPDLVVEGSYPIEKLAAERAVAMHFRGVQAAVALILAERDLLRATPLAPATLRVVEPDEAIMGPDLMGRALSFEAIVRLSLRKDPAAAVLESFLNDLESLSEPSLVGWRFAEISAYVGMHEGWWPRERVPPISTRVAELFPEDPMVWWNLSSAYVATAQWDDAEAALTQAERLGLEPWIAKQQRGVFAFQQGRPAEALRAYKAVKRRQGPTQARRIADCLQLLGKQRSALRHYRRAIRRDHFNRPAVVGADRKSVV